MWFAISTGAYTRIVNPRNIEFLIQEAFTGIRRNGVMAFASISTVALSLSVLGAFVLAAIGANNFAARQMNEFEIAVFMTGKATQALADKTAERIREMPGVESVTVKDRQREWAAFKRQHPDIESAGLPLNPLPYALVVKLADKSRTAAVASQIRRMPGIDRVQEAQATLERVMAVARVIRVISIVGGWMLLITAVFIISNAIRLTLYARRREIRIMQLVGATNSFIRIPLVIEGIVFGAAGALAAWVLLQAGAGYLAHAARTVLPLLADAGSDISPGEMAAALVTVGVAIGALGSLVSIRRFLRD